MIEVLGKTKSSGDDYEYAVKDVLEIYKDSQTFSRYVVYLDEVIADPPKYRSVFSTLSNASEGDVVEFRINSVGGNLYTALQMYNGILNTEARTVAIAEGVVASAATLPLLACDDVMIMNNSFVMVHAAKWGDWGDMKSIRDSVKFQTEALEKLIKDVYLGFMTEEEISDMIENSKEYYMGAEEVISRLRNRQEIIQKGVDEALALEFISEGENREVPRPAAKKTAAKKSPAKKSVKK